MEEGPIRRLIRDWLYRQEAPSFDKNYERMSVDELILTAMHCINELKRRPEREFTENHLWLLLRLAYKSLEVSERITDYLKRV